MNLTPKQWEEMWEEAKRIERYNNSLSGSTSKRFNINLEVAKIKQKIQQVIGQQE